MHAALVTSFDSAPHLATVPDPEPTRPTEIVVDVLAAGLHPRVRSQADGSHYTSTDELPLVPGIDGVGRGEDGRLRYFVLPDTTLGSMAERTVVDTRRSIVLPDDADPVAVAAAMNPVMSSWIALRARAGIRAGQKVLVLGATGSAGRMAVQVARHLGAGSIVAAARNTSLLADLFGAGPTALVGLGDDPATADALGVAAADVDIVLDYLWGAPTAAAMTAIAHARLDDARSLTWVEIGSVAGATAAIPSAALRSRSLQIVGSGQGSVSPSDIRAELPAIAHEISRGTFEVDALAMPLADVADAWADTSSRRRLVLVP